jgi:NitT/TauT family transport system permease protein
VILTLFANQWYVLFNVIAGATAIPPDLAEAARAFRLGRLARWKTVYLPGVMPYLITGLFTSAGGAWNGAIVAEYQDNGLTKATGLGAMISQATDDGDYAMLAATVLVLVITIILLNRFLWSPLHRKTDERYTITT